MFSTALQSNRVWDRVHSDLRNSVQLVDKGDEFPNRRQHFQVVVIRSIPDKRESGISIVNTRMLKAKLKAAAVTRSTTVIAKILVAVGSSIEILDGS
jgi:hypothetical protein